MIETKLVLVEGPPGSGKSTTAHILAAEISQAGKPCQSYLEWSPDHPIPIGDDFHLGQVIASSLARQADVLQHWQQFARERQSQEIVTVMESRFWQTSVMLMYAAGCPIEDVLESNRKVIQAVQGLQPVLIYFVIDDLRAFSRRTFQLKDEEWRRSGNPGTWAQHVYEAFDSQPWFTARRLAGMDGVLAFLEEWSLIAERLYDRLPFPKIKIRNPQHDWALAMGQMRRFLELA